MGSHSRNFFLSRSPFRNQHPKPKVSSRSQMESSTSLSRTHFRLKFKFGGRTQRSGGHRVLRTMEDNMVKVSTKTDKTVMAITCNKQIQRSCSSARKTPRDGCPN